MRKVQRDAGAKRKYYQLFMGEQHFEGREIWKGTTEQTNIYKKSTYADCFFFVFLLQFN